MLLARHSDDLWVPVQIRTRCNGYPRPETITAVETWLGSTIQWEEERDGPF